MIVPPAVVGDVAETVPEAVSLVAHLSELVEPLSVTGRLHPVPPSSQTFWFEVVREVVYALPNWVAVSDGAVQLPSASAIE